MRSAVLSMLAVFMACAAAAQTPSANPTPNDLRADVQTFEAQVLDVDRSFSPAARAEAKARLRALETRLDALGPLEAGVELCRIAALADNGHTGCMSPVPAQPVDVGFYPLNSGIYVFSAAGREADLLGGRLLAIDGRPIGEVQKAVQTLRGGYPAFRDLNTVYAYSRPALLHALGVAESDQAAVYRIRTPAGRVVERSLRITEGNAPAKGILSPERTPWSWRDLGTPLRWRDAPAHDAIVVQLRSNLDQPGHPLGEFLTEIERQRVALGRSTVILDIRSNGGGDLMLTREFLAAWPGKLGPHGRIIVLIGPRTFSAGIADAAYLKQAGGRQVILVGQAPGDGLMFFAEGRPTRLTAVGLVVQPATARDDFEDGCRRYADCFAGVAQPGGPTATPAAIAHLIERMPLQVASLDPDVAAPTTIADYLTGRDSGLVAALDLARPCARSACPTETRALAGPTP